MTKVIIHSPFPELRNEQARASHPDSSDVWLSASAGTGKTQVLTARVLRLLLYGARPESILCLTFTKAGAAEMANRINEILAAWVRLPATLLAKDLMNLGEDHGPDAVEFSRTLFARVLDARGGGLRIQTIHGFCQSLLGSFPAEAGLTPGFRPIEGREEEALARSALADMVADAERGGLAWVTDRLQRLSHRMGEEAARAHLRRCASAPDAMTALGVGVEAKVRRWLGLGDADVDAMLLAGCTDGGFDGVALDRIRALNIAWGTERAMEKVEAITDWLAMSAISRVEHILVLTGVWAKVDGDLKSLTKGWAPQEPDYAALVKAQYAHFNGLLELRQLAQTADEVANALIIGQYYSRTYANSKHAAGVVDFNDLIARTVALLHDPGMGAWIGYKLDQATDHILVDEAQDTNADQWAIVKALAGEFYAGDGAKAAMARTLFTVGDYKQAIFGFQGTDPNEFARAFDHFAAFAQGAERDVLDLSLSQSFRSSQPILDVVNAVIETVTPEAFGLAKVPDQHVSATRGQSGTVTLWPPVGIDAATDENDEEGWIASSERAFAAQLAAQVKAWTIGGLMLRNEGRLAEAGDVLILVRSRGELARLIVSRLYEAGVEVAGVDRLRLNAPIAVQDLLACIRFVLQPADDLNLASLLVSPLIGWSQETLYDYAHGRKVGLWQHLGERKPEVLSSLLSIADLTSPHCFLEHILSGPMRGRHKLLARLGEEARDPIEELVNAALAFEREAAPSLQQFIDWFDRGDVEIKRDPSQPGNAVRVMTVHGAKGLQAPIVVLADATSDPDFKNPRDLNWAAEETLKLPLFRPRKAELVGSLKTSADESDRREREEHWRLLYVALTRAEEHLFIGGALKRKQQKEGLGVDCWHARVEAAMLSMGLKMDGGGAIRLVVEEPTRNPKRDATPAIPVIERPDWLDRHAPIEARPPRPLAPSAIKPEDTVSDPPLIAQVRAAAEKGIFLHSLFERLPDVEPARRREAADRWLTLSAGVSNAAQRMQLIDAALAVIENPDFADIFSAKALAEAPLAGVVGDQVVAGTVDRLLIREDSVQVVDFKTGRRVPAGVEAVPPHHLAQMAAYAAVLESIFPGRRVEASLLYSHGPKLIALPPQALASYKPGFSQ
jgi:ATP-dependent helicase/nuclease subunit A